ncbi:MAG: response regulator [Burkholderiaceae bacterium]
MKTILVVDDEYANAEVLALILADEGYRVVCAANGAEGLEKIRDAHPDLVILDIMMPVMDGAEMAKQMRASPETRHIKIILNSSLSESVARQRCDSYDGFLRKPYNINAALELISRLLSK